MRSVLLLAALVFVGSCGSRSAPAVSPDEVRAKFGFSSDIVEICGSADILGERIAPVGTNSRNPGCGFDDAVRVYAVGGVALSPPARMTCRTARVSERWMTEEVPQALSRERRGLDRVHIVADYSCRTRNHRPGARLSEHAKGTAIDISAFTFSDGTRLSVEEDWNQRVMKRLFSASCRAWSTAIGPDGDRFHQDHFHLDATRDYGPGTYCR